MVIKQPLSINQSIYILLFLVFISVPVLAEKVSNIKFDTYCTEEKGQLSAQFKNKDVKAAYEVLTSVSPSSFYFYSGPMSAYGFKKPFKTDDQKMVKEKNARNFLSILCAEFRDRPTMIKEKLKWVQNLYKLPIEGQKPIDPKKPLWSQISAQSYYPYLRFSSILWNARKSSKAQILVGSYTVDAPVEGQLMCETKFIFSEYIAKSVAFENLEKFSKEYETFASTKGNCSKEELNTYYDFRGDSNFKPNSPESNGMIWYSNSISNQCKTTDSKKENSKLSDEDCRRYFSKPFESRWNAARAGLGSWLFHHEDHDDFFHRETNSIFIVSDLGGGRELPFNYMINGTEKITQFSKLWNPSFWKRPDAGFNSMTGLGTDKVNSGLVYERLRDSVNRHTNWYFSGYDDEMGTKKEQAYSPFVASSYEMSQSDAFTAPGLTVSSPSDGRKHWMFVFKVKKQNWYNSESIRKNLPLDLDKVWFDETSIGTNGLSKKEHAWDRLGSPLEGEYDSILYLHNITTGGLIQSDEPVQQEGTDKQ